MNKLIGSILIIASLSIASTPISAQKKSSKKRNNVAVKQQIAPQPQQNFIPIVVIDTAKPSYIPSGLDVIYNESPRVNFQTTFFTGLFHEATEGDEGVENENDILYASFDTNAIHYPKLNLSSGFEGKVISLVHKDKNEVYFHPTESKVSSRFGPRRSRYHYGIDLSLQTGTPIHSAFDGVVRIAKMNRTYGNLVVVRHNNGLETFYAHLSKIKVHPGDEVKAGDIIGLGGNTGRSYGSHLHFEIRYLGAAINPEDVIDFTNYKLLNEELSLTEKNFRHHNRLPQTNTQYASKSKSKGASYTVRRGDTLGMIAKRNGTTVTKLCKLNGMSKNSKLMPGKRIRLK